MDTMKGCVSALSQVRMFDGRYHGDGLNCGNHLTWIKPITSTFTQWLFTVTGFRAAQLTIGFQSVLQRT